MEMEIKHVTMNCLRIMKSPTLDPKNLSIALRKPLFFLLFTSTKSL